LVQYHLWLVIARWSSAQSNASAGFQDKVKQTFDLFERQLWAAGLIHIWVVFQSVTVIVQGMTNNYSGRCLCGAVTYKADGQPIVVAQCHCDECRRLSGTGHTVGAMFPSKAVTMSGALSKFNYSSGKDSEVSKAFCARCGSPIYGTNSRTPEHLTLPLGSMDDASGLSVQVVIFERDKQHWDQLGQDIVSFATQPDWKPQT
jgi:hypothetical protein